LISIQLLDISNCSNLTEVGVRSAIEKFPNLRSLNVSFNNNSVSGNLPTKIIFNKIYFRLLNGADLDLGTISRVKFVLLLKY